MAKDIVVIDDDPALLEFAAHVLQSEGHRVATFEDGFAALTYLAEANPDVVVIDYVLPRIDGDELCRIIRSMAHLGQCYVVLISAAATEIDRDLGSMCIDACIAKGPFASLAEHLLEVVERSGDPARCEGRVELLGGDQTEPRRITRELFARKRRLERILDCVDDGILEVDSGTVVAANSAAARLLDRPREAVLGGRLRDLVGDDLGSQLEELIGGEAAPEGAVISPPLELNERLVVARRLPGVTAATAVVMLSDVTEQKRLEQQLFRAQKLEAVGTMAGGIAHNFNNLLQGVLGSASLLLSRAEPTDREFTLLKHIEHCGERGAELTRQLLDFARGEAVGRVMVATNAVVEDALKIFEASRRATTVVREYGDGVWKVAADVAAIEQVLLNLCLNASEAMGSGGLITVATGNVELDDCAVAGYGVAPGAYVRVSVTDAGVGVADNVRDRIFEPFFTTKPPGAGTGLGLASSFGIVRNHGGIIDFESRPGHGATFYVYLPASSGPADEPSCDPPHLPGGSESVLLVDDEPEVLAVVRAMLDSLGYRVRVAGGGREAVGAVAGGERFDLVVLDVVMPEMNGWEVARHLWELAPEMPVLFASGYSQDAARKPDEIKGPHAFLQKPVDLFGLGREVRRMLDGGC